MNRRDNNRKSPHGTGSKFGLLIVLFLLFSCTSQHPLSDKAIISVSILPQKYFVEMICGDQFIVNVMIPPGESPATYDPSPEKMKKMAISEIYFLIGHIEFEKSWIIPLKKDNLKHKFSDTSIGIDFETENHDDYGHQHEGIDPHIWMSAPNAKIITKNMLDFLVDKFPEYETIFRSNYDSFYLKLDSIHHHIQQDLSGISHRSFIIYHPALTYFARDYQLKQIPLEYEGKEPSARHMKEIIDHARANNIGAILVQKQFNQDEAKILEKEINGKVIAIDPLDYNWPEQMRYITKQLKAALQ